MAVPSKNTRKVLVALIAVLAAQNLYSQPLSSVMITFGVAFILQGFFPSEYVTIGVLAAPILLKALNITLDKGLTPSVPKKVVTDASGEPFQVKDAVSIHQRLQEVRVNVPKVGAPSGSSEAVGVFETDQEQTPLQALGESVPAAAPVSTSAPVSVNPTIPTPTEGAIPARASEDTTPKMNPQVPAVDRESVQTALVTQGATIPSETVQGFKVGGPAMY